MAELVAGLIAVHGSLSFTAGAWWVSLIRLVINRSGFLSINEEPISW